jgi:hypothetical protein
MDEGEENQVTEQGSLWDSKTTAWLGGGGGGGTESNMWLTHCSDDGGSNHLQNDSKLLRDHMAQYPRRLSSSPLTSW